MTEIIFVFVLVSLVSLRLTVDLAKTSGPFGLYAWVRKQLSQPHMPWWVQEGAICPVCWSQWVSLPAALLGLWVLGGPTGAGEVLLWWLGAAGAVRAYLLYLMGY